MGHSSIHRLIDFLVFLGVVGFGAVSTTGCGAAPTPVVVAAIVDPDGASGGVNDGVDPETVTGDDQNDDDASNDDGLVDSVVTNDAAFAHARTLNVGNGTTQLLEGDISALTQVDVYDIGPVRSGERLIVSVDPRDFLDPVLALFDANGDSMMVNDDRNYYGGDLSSRINMLARHDSAACFVAVAPSFQTNERGGYTLTLTRTGAENLREPAPQVVYLNFDGAGPIAIGQREPVTIPAFEGSQIADDFDGRTDELIEAIVAHVRADYDGLNVEFVSSREDAQPAGPHTTIHFGAYDPGLLGIADYVDEFNAAPMQKAIVYVDTFRAFLSLDPSLEEMAAALANVASHETGHLLGLNHTSDSRDIMDIDASLRQMLADQAFGRSPLHREVFPIGHQDNARLLVESVGGDLARVKASAAAQLGLRARWYDEGDPTPARPGRPFSTCFCESCGKRRHAGERAGR